MRWILLLAVLSLAAPAARAQHFASYKEVDFRIGVSALWLETTSLGGKSGFDTGGFAPLEMGIGFRLSPDTALGLIVRAGLVHYGAGIELTGIPNGDWAHNGLVLRLAPMVIRDALTCLAIEGPAPCSGATYYLVEAGLAYRWAFRSTGGISVGAAVNAGLQHLDNPRSNSTINRSLVLGILGPRLQVEF